MELTFDSKEDHLSKYKYKVVRPSGRSIMIDPRSPFSLQYIDGEVTEAPEGTLGIMLFSRVKDAKEWMEQYWSFTPYIIKRVTPLKKCKTPKNISRGILTRELREFYEDIDSYPYAGRTPVSGTICCQAVWVEGTVIERKC